MTLELMQPKYLTEDNTAPLFHYIGLDKKGDYIYGSLDFFDDDDVNGQHQYFVLDTATLDYIYVDDLKALWLIVPDKAF